MAMLPDHVETLIARIVLTDAGPAAPGEGWRVILMTGRYALKPDSLPKPTSNREVSSGQLQPCRALAEADDRASR